MMAKLYNRKMKYFFLIVVATISFHPLFSQYTVNGNSSRDNCHCYTLTPDAFTQSGSVWNNFKIDLTQSFDFNFDINLGCSDGGADGIVFVLQPISTSVGSSGGGLGFAGITPSVGVSIDTWQNTPDNDPAYDHIAIQLNGNLNHTDAAANIAGPETALANSDNIEDCQWHTLRVQWDPVTKKISAFVDGNQRVSATKDLTADVFAGNPQVFWGFTGSTGGAKNLQRFCTSLSPKFNLPQSQKRCINEPVAFFDSTISFTTVLKRFWDFGDNSPVDSIHINPVHTYSAAGNYTVIQTVVGADGCVEVNTQPLRIGSIPVANFGVADGCKNTTLQFSDSSKTAVGTINEWNWDFGIAGTSALQNPTAAYTTSGTKTVKLNVISLEGCASSAATKFVQVYPDPVVDFDITGTLCQKSSVQFIDRSAVTPGSIASLQYILGNGLQSLQPNPTVKYDSAKTYTVTLTAVSDKNCVQTKTKSISILPMPMAFFTYNAAGCSPATISFADSSYTTDSTFINGWWWNLGNSSTSILQNPIAPYNTGGDITVNLVAKNEKGCFSDTLIKVITLQAKPQAKFGYSKPLCEGRHIQFADSSSIASGTIKSWQWIVDNTVASSEQNPALPISSGNHTVQLIVTNETGCADNTAAVVIFVDPKPAIKLLVSGTCKDSVVTFSPVDLSGGSVQSWQWNFGDSSITKVNDTQYIYSNAGRYHIQLSAITNNGCSNIIDSSITIYGSNASAGADTIIASASQPIYLQATGGDNYEWSPAEGLSSNNIDNPIAVNSEDRIYHLRAYTPAGCDTYDQVLIHIFDGPEIYVPGAFTPNGDTRNDILKAIPVGISRFNYFTVYNRFGHVVFSTRDYRIGWDGYFKGKPQNTGAYIWIAAAVTFRGTDLLRKGTVLLLK